MNTEVRTALNSFMAPSRYGMACLVDFQHLLLLAGSGEPTNKAVWCSGELPGMRNGLLGSWEEVYNLRLLIGVQNDPASGSHAD